MARGRYHHILTIQSKEATQDEWGGDIFDWTTIATVWGNAVPLRGRELVAASAEYAETTVRFYTNYLANVVPEMRVVGAGIPFDIVSVININGLGQELEIMARSGTNEG